MCRINRKSDNSKNNFLRTKDNFKVTDARQAKMINNLKNATYELLKTNAAIWFNKIVKYKKHSITSSSHHQRA